MATKNEPPKRRATPPNVAVTANTQSATARREAEARIDVLIDQFASAHRRLITGLRRSLRKRLPTAHEVVYEYRDCFVISYSPSEHGYEGVLSIRAGETGVQLYFNRGKDLPDPAKLLKGSGNLTRSLTIETASTLTRPEVVSLMEEAVAINSVPFATAGRGSIIIRSTTATKRRPSRTV